MRHLSPVLICTVLLALLLAACRPEPLPSPTSDPNIPQTTDGLEESGEPREQPGEPTFVTPKSGPSSVPLAEPAPEASLPPPTPHPGNSPWVKERLEAVIALYNVTDAGADLLRSLDLRQMRGEPGFFGSYGFKGWAGVGEAKPIGVMHELSHSYWGGFPVEGFPELDWDASAGDELSPAMQRYHSDALAFMAQPPDDYEVFRQRLRHLPGLSGENLEPLFHNVEADLIYNTGGNLALVPPILRKYWSRFIHEGPFASWHDAVSWVSIAVAPGPDCRR
jgi:hypothetical protein